MQTRKRKWARVPTKDGIFRETRWARYFGLNCQCSRGAILVRARCKETVIVVDLDNGRLKSKTKTAST